MLAFAALAFVAATATPSQAPEPRPASPAGALLAVPYVAQTVDLCGGAALAMVLRYWGDTTAAAADFAPLVDRRAHGIATDALTSAARARGWLTLVPRTDGASLDASVRGDVNRGRPVIALIEDSPGNLHYVVIVAVTATEVVFHDPARAPFRVAPLADFDRAWSATDRWMVTVLRDAAAGPIGAAPAVTAGAPVGTAAAPSATPAGPCDALVAQSVTLAGANQHRDAEQGLLTAMRLCPGDAGAQRELAGLRFVQSRWSESSQLARSSLRLGGDDPYLWRLIGTSEFLEGHVADALRAWNRAGEPRIDIVNVTGLTRTRVPVAAGTIGLGSGELLTVAAFEQAQRRIAALPAAAAADLRVAPLADGRVTVEAVVRERNAWPSGLLPLSVMAGRAVINHEVRVEASSPTGSGELWSASWRWDEGRPRVTAGLALPSPSPLPGVLALDATWERESYSRGATTRETRRRVRAGLADWAPRQLRWQAGAAMDRIDAQRYAAIDGGLDQRLFGDRAAVRASGSLWASISNGGAAFRTGSVSVAFRTDTAASSSTPARWSGVLELAAASAAAPRIVWPSAGTGRGQDRLLRAHPLVIDGVIASEAFGRRMLYASTEVEQTVYRFPLGRISAAGFIDATRTSHPLVATTTSGLLVDVGAGLRLRSLKLAGVVRLDVAFGLRDHHHAVSVGWARTWPY